MWIVKNREMRLVALIVLGIIGTALFLLKYAPKLLDSYSTEMSATMFGIILGFSIDRVILLQQRRELSNKILENIYYSPILAR